VPRQAHYRQARLQSRLLSTWVFESSNAKLSALSLLESARLAWPPVGTSRGHIVRLPRKSIGRQRALFHGRRQKNVLDRQPWVTRGELRLAIVVWIERSYYRKRQHRRLRKVTPIEF